MSNSQDDSVGWGDAAAPHDLSLNSIPTDWSGFTRAAKVQRLVDVVEYQLQRVRSGNFDVSKAVQVAALALEGQIELADFYADAESNAKSAKHVSEYVESEAASSYRQEAIDNGVKVTESELKRMASYASNVKDAKSQMVKLEKEHKKWRYIFETLKEAHIFFRNLSKA